MLLVIAPIHEMSQPRRWKLENVELSIAVFFSIYFFFFSFLFFWVDDELQIFSIEKSFYLTQIAFIPTFYINFSCIQALALQIKKMLSKLEFIPKTSSLII